MRPSCDFVPCLSKNSKICGPMFWKIAKAMGDRSSIHLFSAESIARILVVSFLPSFLVVWLRLSTKEDFFRSSHCQVRGSV